MRGGRTTQRGFTLVELMVVVIIIAVLAVIAMPQIARRMQDRRTQQAAHEVSSLYRDARMRALGRGSAVLVRYSRSNNRFDVFEAVRGSGDTADCQRLPVSTCFVPSWDDAAFRRLVASFEPDRRQGMTDIELAVREGTTAHDTFDVCFTPMGRAYSRVATTATLQPLVGVPVAEIWRENPDDHEAIGLMRRVLILPNGNARLGTAVPKP